MTALASPHDVVCSCVNAGEASRVQVGVRGRDAERCGLPGTPDVQL